MFDEMPERERSLNVMMDVLNSLRITRSLKAAWGLSSSLQVLAIGVVIVVGFTLFATLGPRSKQALGHSVECQFPAIYNFGDSNSDTGSASAAFRRVPYPNGISFFGRPSGRYCDGRLIIDFIAQKLGLPYLSAYLDSIEGNFQHGADFAVSGTTIQKVDGKMYESGLNPLSLSVQLLQFEELKERTGELYEQANIFTIRSRLPKLEDFSNALYTLDIGQNDLHNALTTTTEDQAQKLIPELINQFASAVKTLYQLGARTFWIHNTGPIGCLPYLVLKYPPKPGNLDQTGCIKSFNEVAQEFNRQLKNSINKLRIQLQGSFLVYVDIYSAKYSLISDAKNNGFVDPLGYCCKHLGNSKLDCSHKDMVNGTVIYATPCENRAEYISWDSAHYTEAANRWVADRISEGSFSDPPLPFSRLCKKLVSPLNDSPSKRSSSSFVPRNRALLSSV